MPCIDGMLGARDVRSRHMPGMLINILACFDVNKYFFHFICAGFIYFYSATNHLMRDVPDFLCLEYHAFAIF